MYQDGHRRAKNQSNWSNASTVQVQKVRGQTYSVPPDFQVGGPGPTAPCSYAPVAICHALSSAAVPRGCSPLLTYQTSPEYRRSIAFWVELCVLCRRYVHVGLKFLALTSCDNMSKIPELTGFS